MKLYIGYEYTSALGKEIRKIVVCNSVEEYREIKELIEDTGYDPIEFLEIRSASSILKK